MRIGLDFDNTIVVYGDLFFRCARELGLIDEGVPPTKTAVRDEIRRRHGNDPWVQLQGLVYGVRIAEAQPAPGVERFLERCVRDGHEVSVVSFRTRVAEAGPRYDLHEAATNWLDAQRFYARGLLDPTRAFFEVSLEAKLQRIAMLRCDAFVDDLLANFVNPAFPPAVRPLLYDSPEHDVPPGIEVCQDWPAVERRLLDT